MRTEHPRGIVYAHRTQYSRSMTSLTGDRFIMIIHIAACFVVLASGQSLKVNVTGDVILGAMFPIHHLGDDDQCATGIHDHFGIHNLEALLFALGLANEHILNDLSKFLTVKTYKKRFSSSSD